MLGKKVLLILLIMLLTSCASVQGKFRESEILDQFWDELSQDLAELQVMINSSNKKFELEDFKLNVKTEPWKYPLNMSLKIDSVSLAIKKMTEAKLPTEEGYLAAKIYKIKEEVYTDQSLRRSFYLVLHPTKPSNTLHYMTPKKIMIGLDPKLNKVEKNKLINFLNLDNMLYAYHKDIIVEVKKLQEKYENSPIYIDGFTIHTGIPHSIDISIKFK
jgi:hypothetical protein